jgi:hypothetical protein
LFFVSVTELEHGLQRHCVAITKQTHSGVAVTKRCGGRRRGLGRRRIPHIPRFGIFEITQKERSPNVAEEFWLIHPETRCVGPTLPRMCSLLSILIASPPSPSSK